MKRLAHKTNYWIPQKSKTIELNINSVFLVKQKKRVELKTELNINSGFFVKEKTKLEKKLS